MRNLPTRSLPGSSFRGILLLSLLTGLATPPARAASPASGTVTPSSQTVISTGGPFANDNQLNVGPNVPNIPFSGIYYVGMNTDSSGAVSFEYGTVEVQVIGLVLGNPITHRIGSVSGTHSADGTIQFVVPKALVGFPAPGDILGDIYARTFAGTADETMRSNSGIDTAGSPVATPQLAR